MRSEGGPASTADPGHACLPGIRPSFRASRIVFWISGLSYFDCLCPWSGASRRPEYVVWEQVCEVLTKPERLLALAEEYLGLRGKQVAFERDEYGVTRAKSQNVTARSSRFS